MSVEWQIAAGMVALVTSVVGLPLGVLVFFIRHTRRTEAECLTQAHRRLDQVESGLRRLWEEVANVRRDGATKEEWVRESMWIRNRMESMNQGLARLESYSEESATLSVTAGRIERSVGQILETQSAAASTAARSAGDEMEND